MKKITWIVMILVFLFFVIFAGVFTYKNQTSYLSVGRYAIVNGKLAFEATKFTGQEVIVYDGKEYGKKYDSVYKPQEINGRLVYSAYKRVGTEINDYIIYGNETIGDTEDYYGPSYPVEVNGTLAYEAYFHGEKNRANGKSRIVYESQVYGEEYKWASEIADIGGNLAYVGKRNGENYIVYNGVEVGEGENPTSVNGTIAYLSGNKVVFGDTIIGGDYEIYREYRGKVIYDINGTPAFIAMKGDKSFIVYEGIEQEEEHNNEIPAEGHALGTRFNIFELNGSLAYGFINPCIIGKKRCANDMTFVYSEEEYAALPFVYKDEMGFVQKKGRMEYLSINNKIISSTYKDIAFIVEIEGKLIFVAEKSIGYSSYDYP